MVQQTKAFILVVDDEPAILRALRTILSRQGYQVETAETGRQALDLHERRHPDLVLLDLGLPDMDGMEVVKAVRAWSSTPIVILSVRGEELDKVEALDLGADDYLVKPFGVDELLARIRAGLRHAVKPRSGAEPVFRTGELEVDLEHRRVRVGGNEVHLTPTEYALLKAFINHPDKIMTDRMLLQQVWGPQYGSESHYLHVYVARLRRKLEPDPQNPRYLVTDPGVGYRLVTEGG
ncbi:MAG: response regulator transcription factor [Chloroflexi bacterium]|nr:response regulator transcription factor [Chloroflexota bacterium]